MAGLSFNTSSRSGRFRGKLEQAFSALLFVLLAASAMAQDGVTKPVEATAVARKAWELGVFAGGGLVTSKPPDTRFLVAGGRLGRVVTNDHLPGWLRGNYEFAGEFLPVYVFFTPAEHAFGSTIPAQSIYGMSLKAVFAQWNFTTSRHVVPYAHLAGGILFSTSNVPPGNGSSVNFTPQLGGGIHWFRRANQSFDFGCDVVHHSSAGLGTSPGYKYSVLFTLGFSWFGRRHRT